MDRKYRCRFTFWQLVNRLFFDGEFTVMGKENSNIEFSV